MSQHRIPICDASGPEWLGWFAVGWSPETGPRSAMVRIAALSRFPEAAWNEPVSMMAPPATIDVHFRQIGRAWCGVVDGDAEHRRALRIAYNAEALKSRADRDEADYARITFERILKVAR